MSLLIVLEILILEGGFMDLISFFNDNGPFFQTVILLIGAIIAIRQLSILNRQLKASSLQQIQLNDLEIKTLRFNKPWLFDDSKPLSHRREKQLEYYMNLLLHHANNIYIHNKLATLPEGYWDAVERDLKYSLKDPSFKRAWDRTKNYFPKDFHSYLDSLS